ncbi:MAG: hypothetical protein AB9900_10910 [Humidesulfovibrio sp.]
MKLRIPLFLLLLALPAFGLAAGHLHPEKWYQERWCADRGRMEVVMGDGSRCDCLTETHAVEFDFGHNWAEAIGQALNYSAQTGKRPGIVLILERIGDERYLERIRTVDRAYGLGICVWVVDREGRER